MKKIKSTWPFLSSTCMSYVGVTDLDVDVCAGLCTCVVTVLESGLLGLVESTAGV